MPRNACSECSRASATLKRIRSGDIPKPSYSAASRRSGCGRQRKTGFRAALVSSAGGRRFVEAAARAEDRSRLKTGSLAGARRGGERLQRLDKLVERRLALGLG